MSKEHDNFKRKQRLKHHQAALPDSPHDMERKSQDLGEQIHQRHLRQREIQNRWRLPHPYNPETHGIAIAEACSSDKLVKYQEQFQSTRTEERLGLTWRVLNERHTLLEFDCQPEAFNTLRWGDPLIVISSPKMRFKSLDGILQHAEAAILKSSDKTVLYQDFGFDLDKYLEPK